MDKDRQQNKEEQGSHWKGGRVEGWKGGRVEGWKPQPLTCNPWVYQTVQHNSPICKQRFLLRGVQWTTRACEQLSHL